MDLANSPNADPQIPKSIQNHRRRYPPPPRVLFSAKLNANLKASNSIQFSAAVTLIPQMLTKHAANPPHCIIFKPPIIFVTEVGDPQLRTTPSIPRVKIIVVRGGQEIQAPFLWIPCTIPVSCHTVHHPHTLLPLHVILYRLLPQVYSTPSPYSPLTPYYTLPSPSPKCTVHHPPLGCLPRPFSLTLHLCWICSLLAHPLFCSPPPITFLDLPAPSIFLIITFTLSLFLMIGSE